MADVEITINGRGYTVSCDDGQEGRLKHLAQYLDTQVSRLASQMGQVGDSRLLLLAGLMIADELTDTLERLKTAEDTVQNLRAERDAVTSRLQASESRAANALDGAAHRIETIVRRIDAAQAPSAAKSDTGGAPNADTSTTP
ncbi:MAG: cell division protein ZapA [Pseudomonadota bacterium]